MLKRRLDGKTLGTLFVLLMSVCLSTFAALRTEEWTLNPSDYRYDMSLYFSLASKDYENLETYEIGAFVGDECRGLAEKLDLPDGGSCLYMRIRSNSPSGEQIEFLMRDRKSGETTVIRGKDNPFLFQSDKRVGLPSAPYAMQRYFDVTVKAGEHGSVAFKDGMYAEGTELTLNAVAAEGYHFESWSDGDTNAERKLTVSADVDLTASFAVTSYKAVFKIGENVIATLDVDYGAPIAAPEAPTLEGQTFGGWTDVPATMPARDIEITGSYTANIYNAVFRIDGEVVATLELPFGAAVEAPAAPEKEGYTFVGWADVPATMPAKDIEIAGSYKVNIYKVVFKLDGEVIQTSEVPFGEPVKAPDAPEREGYVFSGWTNLPETMPAHDLEVIGGYSAGQYEAVFKIGDEVVAVIRADYGSVIELPAAPEKEGHTFHGWADVPATMPAKNLEITGSYTVNIYKAVFKIGDDVMTTNDVTYGAPVETPTVPEREGYTFDGWTGLPETMPAQDIEVTGSYSINTYKVTFKVDDEVVTTVELPFGAAIETPAAPEKEGYTFHGWVDVPATIGSQDIEISGIYTVNTYKAVFKVGDEVVSAVDATYGSPIEAPAVPEMAGYTFSGWTGLPETMPAHDIEVTGSYAANTYKAVFKIDDEVIATLDVAYGEIIVTPAAPDKEGHTFSGWADVPATMPGEDIEITGVYTVNIYKATFKVGEEVVSVVDTPYGSPIEVPAVPEMIGNTFSGWTGLPETMPAQDIEVTGSYTANVYKAVFKIGDDVIATLDLTYGAFIETPAAPDKEGHTFNGWADVPTTMPGEDIEVTGSYTVNIYKATFKVGEEVVSVVDTPYGSSIEVPAVPEAEGHTFNGWTGLPETMPAQDIEVTGSYSANVYKVVFKVGDEVVSTQEVAYGATVEAPAAPEKEGYVFSGWTNLPATMPAGDLEITGSFTVGAYEAIFKIGDEVIATIRADYGSAIESPAAPEKEGYTFDGWANLPATMPAGNIEITGSYTINVYKAVFKIDDVVVSTVEVPFGGTVEAPAAPEKEGYSFESWFYIPETMPARDIEIVGSYIVNVYKAVFNLGGTVIATLEVPYGSVIEAPAVNQPDGYTFSGWSEMPETMPAKDIEITGAFITNVYKAVFKVDDVVVSTVEVPFGGTIEAPAAPEKEGYTFESWFYIPETMPANDLEIVGSYTVNVYKAVFKVGDEVIATVEVPYGSAIDVPVVPQQDGYSFDGWANIPETMPANDIEITGTFTANVYKAVFKVDDVVVSTVEVPFGGTIEAPAAPEKEGYSFESWFYIPETMPAQDIEIVGSYTVNVYKAVFKVGDEVISTLEIAYGTVIEAPVAPQQEGYTFDGWANVPETMPANDIEISGSFTVNVYKAVFKIGDEILSTIEVPFGSAIEAPAAPEKEGHTFDGWFLLPETMPSYDLELVGSYTTNIYKAVFKVGDEEITTIELPYGTPIEAPVAPQKEGYTFDGWANVPETMPAADIEVSGSFTVNVYKAVFKIGDEVIATLELPYGTDIEAPAAPEKEGYSFEGWEGLPATMPAMDIELTGSYVVNLYRLTFYIDDEVYMTTELEFGAAIEAPTPKAPANMKFDGWKEEIPATMPAHDVEIHGTFSELQSGIYGITVDNDELVTVYSINGVLLYKDITAGEAKARLTPGFYIVNGRKVVIKAASQF